MKKQHIIILMILSWSTLPCNATWFGHSPQATNVGLDDKSLKEVRKRLESRNKIMKEGVIKPFSYTPLKPNLKDNPDAQDVFEEATAEMLAWLTFMEEKKRERAKSLPKQQPKQQPNQQPFPACNGSWYTVAKPLSKQPAVPNYTIPSQSQQNNKQQFPACYTAAEHHGKSFFPVFGGIIDCWNTGHFYSRQTRIFVRAIYNKKLFPCLF